MKLTIVRCKAWTALYRDGHLVCETPDMADVAEACGATLEVVSAERSWLVDRGNYPLKLSNVKEEGS